MEYLALIIACAALAFAWRAWLEAANATQVAELAHSRVLFLEKWDPPQGRPIGRDGL